MEVFTCVCQDSYTVEIPALRHEYVDYICIRCGEKDPNYEEPFVGSEGLEYGLNGDKKSYSVVGVGACTDADVVIPSTYDNLPVTGIGSYAFSYCSNLTSVNVTNR